MGAELVLEGDVLVVYTSVDWVIEGIPCIDLSSRAKSAWLYLPLHYGSGTDLCTPLSRPREDR